MTSVGEALIEHLIENDVEVVFGIPGVHTIELYRGFKNSSLRHVTPRHEQGAGFMADGYARATGKPGVALVITGPGVTNTLTPIAQARADSVPILVISGVNELTSLGKGLGCLHELPDQQETMATVAGQSIRIDHAEMLGQSIDHVFTNFEQSRPGPIHVEVPLDVAARQSSKIVKKIRLPAGPSCSADEIDQVAKKTVAAKSPLILAGGGMRFFSQEIEELAEKLNAPTVLTVNARGLMHGHELVVPASPSLSAIRDLINESDLVLALGTELGKTDFDMYATGTMPDTGKMIRVDICAEQLSIHPVEMGICADAGIFTKLLNKAIDHGSADNSNGAVRAKNARMAAFKEIGPEMQILSELLCTIRDAAPGSILVGDSTQPVYAGNLYYDHDKPGGWFNAATGYGALGYGIPAAIGAAIGSPESRVICLCGDGGAQFSLSEMMTAVDEELPIIFVIWNNRGYREIETSMQHAGVGVVGCDPTPPNFEFLARSFGMTYYCSKAEDSDLSANINKAMGHDKPVLLEIVTIEDG